jgi:hypothetical protein
MTEEQLFSWEKLYGVLELAQLNKIQLCVCPVDHIYISIDQLQHMESGCGQCNIRYDSFYIEGLIKSDYEPRVLPYSAGVNQTDMHHCAKRPEEGYCKDEFVALFKGYMPDTKHCVCDLYLDLDELTKQLTQS